MGSNSIPIWHPSLTAIVIAQLSFAPLTEYKKMRECGGLGLSGRAGQTGTDGWEAIIASLTLDCLTPRPFDALAAVTVAPLPTRLKGAMDGRLRDLESFER